MYEMCISLWCVHEDAGWLKSFNGLVKSPSIIRFHSLSNILKADAAQTKIVPAQNSTNEAQTNETSLGEFRTYGGLSDLRTT